MKTWSMILWVLAPMSLPSLWAQQSSKATSWKLDIHNARLTTVNGQTETAFLATPEESISGVLHFNGPCINVFRANENGKVSGDHCHINPEQIQKLEIDGRIFEAHQVLIPGQGVLPPNFYERVYKSAAIEIFESPVCGNGYMDIRYYARIPNNPTLFQLQGIIRSNRSNQYIGDSPELQRTDLNMQREAIIKVGDQFTASRQASLVKYSNP